jgi:hypothetical protein
MAILRGFPPSNTISPSVRITEKDLSFIAPEQSFHRAGLIGFASKGPVNVPTLVSTQRQLNTVFGFPHPESGDPYLIYAAEQYLLVANELYIVRVADEDNVSDEKAEVATVEVPSAGGQIQIISDTSGPYTFTKDSFFRWRLNGVLHSKTLVVLAGVFVVDPGCRCVSEILPDGRGLRTFGEAELVNPVAVTADRWGRVWVLDSAQQSIRIFFDGLFAGAIAFRDLGVIESGSIAIHDSTLYVADTRGGRIGNESETSAGRRRG